MNKIKHDMSIMDAGVAMAQGNPGAATVLGMLLKDDQIEGFVDFCHLDDMQIYGSNIWLCYKDICKEDLQLLKTKIRNRTIKDELVALPDYESPTI